MLQSLMFAYYMSERITIVVPDGTRNKLKEKAAKQGHTPSSLGRKLLTDGLKECEHEFVTIYLNQKGEEIYKPGPNSDYNMGVKCSKCGLRQ